MQIKKVSLKELSIDLVSLFPRTLRPFLKRIEKECVLYTACDDLGILLGAVLVEKAIKSAQILYVVVKPGYRRQKIATRLMSHVEKNLIDAGHFSLFIEISESHEAKDFLSNILQEFSWSPWTPASYFFAYRYHAILENKYFNFHFLEKTYTLEVFDPQTRNYEKIDEILSRRDFDPALNYLNLLEPLCYPASLLLKKENRVVGWIACHTLDLKTFKVTSAYLVPEVYLKGMFLTLLAQSMIAAHRAGFDFFIHFVSFDNKKMLDFGKKAFFENAFLHSLILRSTKKLCSNSTIASSAVSN